MSEVRQKAVAGGRPQPMQVPRTAPRMEQFIRARRFESLGLLTLVDLRSSTTGDLGEAVRFELNRPADARPGLPFTGLVRAGQEFKRLTAEARRDQPDMAHKGDEK